MSEINAPSSTKNADKARDLHSTMKGKESVWHEGARWFDAGSGYVTGVTATAANVHDVSEAAMIRPDDEVLYGDSGYLVLRNEKRS